MPNDPKRFLVWREYHVILDETGCTPGSYTIAESLDMDQCIVAEYLIDMDLDYNEEPDVLEMLKWT